MAIYTELLELPMQEGRASTAMRSWSTSWQSLIAALSRVAITVAGKGAATGLRLETALEERQNPAAPARTGRHAQSGAGIQR
jgi:hypothetical protein